MPGRSVSKQTLSRLPAYLHYLQSLPEEAGRYISATAVAEALGLNDVVVRKDLAAVSSSGRPKVGYVRAGLIGELEHFLGYDNTQDAILVGAGKLGRALLSYDVFPQYGLNILAGFDIDPPEGLEEGGKKILPMEKLPNGSGILAVWNFSNVHLSVPEGVLVQNENMAVSLAILSNHLKERFSTK